MTFQEVVSHEAFAWGVLAGFLLSELLSRRA